MTAVQLGVFAPLSFPLVYPFLGDPALGDCFFDSDFDGMPVFVAGTAGVDFVEASDWGAGSGQGEGVVFAGVTKESFYCIPDSVYDSFAFVDDDEHV